MPNIKAGADKFEIWFKDLAENPIPDINNALIKYLNNYDHCGFAGGGLLGISKRLGKSFIRGENEIAQNYGFYYVKTYGELCELADELKSRGYNDIKCPPCTTKEYDRAVAAAEYQRKNYGPPAILPERFEKKITTFPILTPEFLKMFLWKKQTETEPSVSHEYAQSRLLKKGLL